MNWSIAAVCGWLSNLPKNLGVGLDDVAAAFVAARELFDFRALWSAIDAAPVAGVVQLDLHIAAIDGVAHPDGRYHPLRRWPIARRFWSRGCAPGVDRLASSLETVLRPEPRAQLDRYRGRLTMLGAPDEIADRLVRIEALDGAVGVSLLASAIGADEAATAAAYTALGEATGLDWAKGAAAALDPVDPWERLLKAGLVRDFEALRLDMMHRIVGRNADPGAAVADWLADNDGRVSAHRGAGGACPHRRRRINGDAGPSRQPGAGGAGELEG